jgi:DNA-binding transcriptional ArsR family regulator
MDSVIASSARLLAAGDPLGALKRVALRNDPPALALRGIAMAQLGDYERARMLLRSAARAFGARERFSAARCQVAEAEVALAARDLTFRMSVLAAAAKTLDAFGDPANAIHARLIITRRHLLVGELEAAARSLASIDVSASTVPPALVARAELTQAELALRHVRATVAAAALARAHTAAAATGIPALMAEIRGVQRALSIPSAHLIKAGVVHPARLDEVERLLASGNLIVDGCRRTVSRNARRVVLAQRPVLFALALALAQAWPADASRNSLIEAAFQARISNESHRARLRVELGRLRSALRSLARIHATPRGFMLVPIRAAAVVVLAPPIEGSAGSILALLEDGESWSTSALACALGSSQRTVQRELGQLVEAGAVRSVGRGRARRWLAPAFGGFAPTLLLPGALQMV